MSQEIKNNSDIAKAFADHFQEQTDMEFKPVVQIDYSNSPAVKDIKKNFKAFRSDCEKVFDTRSKR
ncbi:hypothetical protein [Listeria aquatica]|uniref:Uncharacterized protein n=1 Tax=Listeria aquatica FSL S10-1188 TaxID=1265818 RepID=W7B250_9LIST|nr:hypothetical protein [Listeria aquatica]EUJ21304.1 hypothetical protein MAQA_01037 [Listeria aquatica FSL S10-1188]